MVKIENRNMTEDTYLMVDETTDETEKQDMNMEEMIAKIRQLEERLEALEGKEPEEEQNYSEDAASTFLRTGSTDPDSDSVAFLLGELDDDGTTGNRADDAAINYLVGD